MAEQLEGLVTGFDGNLVRLRPRKHSECGDCMACQAPGLEVLARSIADLHVGDLVQYEETSQGILLIAWVMFLQPLAAVFIGLGLGAALAPTLGWPSAWAMTLGGALLFALAAAFVVWFDRRYRKRDQGFAKIVAVLSSSASGV